MKNKVLGSTWKIFDSTLTGRYGDAMEYWDDCWAVPNRRTSWSSLKARFHWASPGATCHDPP